MQLFAEGANSIGGWGKGDSHKYQTKIRDSRVKG